MLTGLLPSFRFLDHDLLVAAAVAAFIVIAHGVNVGLADRLDKLLKLQDLRWLLPARVGA